MNYYIKSPSKGFTLLEILIGLALLSVLVLALYGSFFTVLRGQSAINDELEMTRAASRFMDTFSREIHAASFKTNNPKISFIGERVEIRGKSADRLTLATIIYPTFKQGRPSSDLLSIRYSAEEGPDKRLALYKEAWNPYTGERGIKAEVIEDVEGFEISYFNGKDWAKAWDASLEKGLPKAVRVRIEVKDKGDIRKFSTLARIIAG